MLNQRRLLKETRTRLVIVLIMISLRILRRRLPRFINQRARTITKNQKITPLRVSAAKRKRKQSKEKSRASHISKVKFRTVLNLPRRKRETTMAELVHSMLPISTSLKAASNKRRE